MQQLNVWLGWMKNGCNMRSSQFHFFILRQTFFSPFFSSVKFFFFFFFFFAKLLENFWKWINFLMNRTSWWFEWNASSSGFLFYWLIIFIHSRPISRVCGVNLRPQYTAKLWLLLLAGAQTILLVRYYIHIYQAQNKIDHYIKPNLFGW